MASAGARAYNGGLGAEPPAGSRGRANVQVVRGLSRPEAEAYFASGHSTDLYSLLIFQYFTAFSVVQFRHGHLS